MSLIQTPWTSQPQQAVGIDWSNPITRGLVFAWNGRGCELPAVSNFIGTPKFSASNNGFGISPDGSGAVKFPIATNPRLDQSLSTTGFSYFVVLNRKGAPSSNYQRPFGRTANNGGVPYINWDFELQTSGAIVAAYYALGTSQNITSSALPTTGRQVLLFTYDGVGTINFYVNGALIGTRSHALGVFATNSDVFIGAQSDASLHNINAEVLLAGVSHRFFTDYEARQLHQNPWQIFKPLPRRIFVPVAAGDPTLYPSLYTNTNNFYAPTVSVGDVTLTPSLFSNSNTFHSATVTLGGATQTLTPSLYSNTNTFYGPSVSPGAVTLTPSLVTNTNSFFSAVVTLDSDKILYPSLVSNSNSFYGPTVSVGAVSLLPSLFVNSNTFYNHVVGGALTDSEKIDLILDILSNRQTLDATTGIYTLYADDGVTVLKTAQAWEDAEGTQPYRGRGLKRLDALQ